MNKNTIEFHNRLIQTARESLRSIEPRAERESLTIQLMIHYLTKGYKLLRGISLLCRELLATDAKILLRSLFECFLLSAYIADAPDDIRRVEDCQIRGIVAEKRQLQHVRNLKLFDIEAIDDDEIKEQVVRMSNRIEERSKKVRLSYEEAIAKLRTRQDYKDKDDKETERKFVREIDNSILGKANKSYESIGGKNLIQTHYAMVVRDLSASVHCNDFGVHCFVSKSGRLQYTLDDSEQHTERILTISARLFIEIANLTNCTLELGKDQTIKELIEEQRNIKA